MAKDGSCSRPSPWRSRHSDSGSPLCFRRLRHHRFRNYLTTSPFFRFQSQLIAIRNICNINLSFFVWLHCRFILMLMYIILLTILGEEDSTCRKRWRTRIWEWWPMEDTSMWWLDSMARNAEVLLLITLCSTLKLGNGGIYLLCRYLGLFPSLCCCFRDCWSYFMLISLSLHDDCCIL